jgi:hypothetical protein
MFANDGNSTDNQTSNAQEIGSNMSRPSLRGAPESADEVLARCQSLLNELQLFADYCDRKKYNGDYRQRPEYNHFRSDIEQEVKQMEKVHFSLDLYP